MGKGEEIHFKSDGRWYNLLTSQKSNSWQYRLRHKFEDNPKQAKNILSFNNYWDTNILLKIGNKDFFKKQKDISNERNDKKFKY